jgi:hypothetical protein
MSKHQQFLIEKLAAPLPRGTKAPVLSRAMAIN